MHTPGPWQEWNLFGSRTMKNWRVGSKASPGITTPVAVVDDSIPSDEQVANARLIAASPDMLAALVTIADRLEAWAETHERDIDTTVGVERDSHINRAANYRDLIRIARDPMPK